MRVTFEAIEANFDADEYALVCGVASGSQYITFQREAEGTGEDWGVYLEYGDQANGGYGCISTCRLSRSELCVDLSRPLGSLAGVEGFTVRLRFDDRSFEALRAGLVGVFRGMPGALLTA